jgi:hypothetical protein
MSLKKSAFAPRILRVRLVKRMLFFGKSSIQLLLMFEVIHDCAMNLRQRERWGNWRVFAPASHHAREVTILRSSTRLSPTNKSLSNARMSRSVFIYHHPVAMIDPTVSAQDEHMPHSALYRTWRRVRPSLLSSPGRVGVA